MRRGGGLIDSGVGRSQRRPGSKWRGARGRGGVLVIRWDRVLGDDGRCGLGPMEAEVVAEGRERR